MRFDKDPERSPSPVSSPSEDDNIDDDDADYEADLLESIAEKEAEVDRTQELINERNIQVQATLAALHQINSMLKQFETLMPVDKNVNN
ncbi:hypothetical protein I4U23_020061 [Adineta vaga]|nr:hypothetical protein I4U23_020061 [Adineta vaga]